MLGAEEPADGLGEVARVAVLGHEDSERPLETFVQGRDNQRQGRIGYPSTRPRFWDA